MGAALGKHEGRQKHGVPTQAPRRARVQHSRSPQVTDCTAVVSGRPSQFAVRYRLCPTHMRCDEARIEGEASRFCRKARAS